MKHMIAALTSAVAMSLSVAAWGGPAEEIAQFGGARFQAYQQGNVEAFTSVFADNAVLTPSFSPFRVEGKEAIRAFFAQFFQAYPKRTFAVRQPITRAYGDDLVIQNSYLVISATNAAGGAKNWDARFTSVWHKIDGQWRIVEQHVSRLPHADD